MTAGTPPDAPRELFCVEVDVERWAAEDPADENDQWARRRTVSPSMAARYRAPIFTFSRQQVTGIVTQFGKEYVRVRYAPVPDLCWFDSEWPRRKPRPVKPADGQAPCPHCGAVESIVEVESHNGTNDVCPIVDGGAPHIASVHQESVDRDALLYLCRACGSEVTFPETTWEFSY